MKAYPSLATDFALERGRATEIMPRRLPTPHPKGVPRTPDPAGRRACQTGQAVEPRELMAALVDDLEYQSRLREDFRKRRVYPSTEGLVWAYVVGKPVNKVEMSASVSMGEKLAAERELLRQLTLPELESLAAESQALMDRALAMARPQGVVPAGAPLSHAAADEDSIGEPAEKSTGTDVD
jgi:hypothetical protein